MQSEFDTVVDDGKIERNKASRPPESFDPVEASIELFTSGSTGDPKRIRKTFSNFLAESAALEDLWGHDFEAAEIVATVPHQHLYGLTFKIVWPLLSRRPFLAETFGVWEDCLAAMKPGAVLISSPAPPHPSARHRDAVRQPRVSRRDLGRIRIISRSVPRHGTRLRPRAARNLRQYRDRRYRLAPPFDG